MQWVRPQIGAVLFGTLWRGYRQELWDTRDFWPLWAGTGGDWATNAAWRGGLGNASAGSLRT